MEKGEIGQMAFLAQTVKTLHHAPNKKNPI